MNLFHSCIPFALLLRSTPSTLAATKSPPLLPYYHLLHQLQQAGRRCNKARADTAAGRTKRGITPRTSLPAIPTAENPAEGVPLDVSEVLLRAATSLRQQQRSETGKWEPKSKTRESRAWDRWTTQSCCRLQLHSQSCCRLQLHPRRRRRL